MDHENHHSRRKQQQQQQHDRCSHAPPLSPLANDTISSSSWSSSNAEDHGAINRCVSPRERLSPKRTRGTATNHWLERLRFMSIVESAKDDDDDAVVQSSVLAGRAERNAFEMKQALREWNLVDAEDQSRGTKHPEDSKDSTVSLSSDDGSEVHPVDVHEDVLVEEIHVAESSTTFASMDDASVESHSRDAVEESNRQAATAEQTAKEMKQALEWLKEDEILFDDSKDDDLSDVKTLSNDLTPPGLLETPETTQSRFLLSLALDGDVPEIPWEDTNLMEAHLAAQEQTSAVQVVCYETNRMAEVVAELVQEQLLLQNENNAYVKEDPWRQLGMILSFLASMRHEALEWKHSQRVRIFLSMLLTVLIGMTLMPNKLSSPDVIETHSALHFPFSYDLCECLDDGFCYE